MVAQYYSPSSVAIKPKSNLSSSTVATVTVSTLALIGMLATVVVLTVKLSKRLSQQSKEKEPLLEDR